MPRKPRPTKQLSLQPASAPAQQVTAPAAAQEAHFLPDLVARRSLFDYLELSYAGGINYKYGLDAQGQRILVDHENESTTGSPDPSFVFPVTLAKNAGRAVSVTVGQRYARRQRIAAYENLVKPIVDKIVAYVLGNKPERDEKLQAELERINLDEWIEKLLCEGCKLKEAWIGYDTIALPAKADGSVYTEAEVAQIDPVHKGKPYLLMVDARRVVDFDQDKDGTVTRVVFEEIATTKASLISQPVVSVTYKEWNADSWTVYQPVRDQPKSAPNGATAATGAKTTISPSGVNVQVVTTGKHEFGCCPWYRFIPPFPVEDIAELNRLIFNLSSLTDEECFNSTFTQKYVLGASVEEVKGATTGTGNLFVIDSPNAKFGVVGAVPGHLTSLMARIASLRDSVYSLVNMENTSTKNVAETAAKKKRDLEALYTMLVAITVQIERVENWLLTGLFGDGDVSSTKFESSKYGREFDVFSINELMEEINALGDVPYIPASIRRRLASQLIQKLDPFGDHAALEKEIEEAFDGTPKTADAMATLKNADLLTPEMFGVAVGLPDKLKKGLEDHIEEAKQLAHAIGGDPVNPDDPSADPSSDQGGPDTGNKSKAAAVGSDPVQ